MIRRPPRSTLFPTRRSSDLFRFLKRVWALASTHRAATATNEATALEIKKATHKAIKRVRSEEHTSELQSQSNLVCRLLLEKKKKKKNTISMRETPHRLNVCV